MNAREYVRNRRTRAEDFLRIRREPRIVQQCKSIDYCHIDGLALVFKPEASTCGRGEP